MLLWCTTASSAAETGLVKLPEPTGNTPGTCLQSGLVKFVCITAGAGATEVVFGNEAPFVFPHGGYASGSGVNVSRLDGAVSAGNLSRSANMDCYDNQTGRMDYCYYTSAVVHLTPPTRCMTLSCRTRFSPVNGPDIVVPFGSSTVARSKLMLMIDEINRCSYPPHDNIVYEPLILQIIFFLH